MVRNQYAFLKAHDVLIFSTLSGEYKIAIIEIKEIGGQVFKALIKIEAYITSRNGYTALLHAPNSNSVF
ncbi:hypothetical protein [Mucilaginibacter dorajii]|uniref:hypothetical protein n=1 Tax=Mucilaginibacter dorajii TaxID=692994 RepID=UPI00216A6E3C|nr:hypothetical protein [Mucilaginibacter dorajii]